MDSTQPVGPFCSPCCVLLRHLVPPESATHLAFAQRQRRMAEVGAKEWIRRAGPCCFWKGLGGGDDDDDDDDDDDCGYLLRLFI